MSDDEAIRRILSSGKEESDRRAERGFPPGPADGGDGRGSSYSSEGGGSTAGGAAGFIASIVFTAMWEMSKAIFSAGSFLLSSGGKRRRR